MRKIIIKFCDFVFGKHKNNTLPRYWILAADMCIVIFAYVIAVLMLYFDYLPDLVIDWQHIWFLPIPYLIAFLISRTYDGMLRYAGFNDIRKIFSSCTWTLAILVFSKLFFIKVNPAIAVTYYPRIILIVYHYAIYYQTLI